MSSTGSMSVAIPLGEEEAGTEISAMESFEDPEMARAGKKILDSLLARADPFVTRDGKTLTWYYFQSSVPLLFFRLN